MRRSRDFWATVNVTSIRSSAKPISFFEKVNPRGNSSSPQSTVTYDPNENSQQQTHQRRRQGDFPANEAVRLGHRFIRHTKKLSSSCARPQHALHFLKREWPRAASSKHSDLISTLIDCTIAIERLGNSKRLAFSLKGGD
jgi:hypothetical protein